MSVLDCIIHASPEDRGNGIQRPKPLLLRDTRNTKICTSVFNDFLRKVLIIVTHFVILTN